MKIENPTYENLVLFLGRHVSLTTSNGQIHSGCLVAIFSDSVLWVGLDSPSDWYNKSTIKANIHYFRSRSKFVGPKSIIAVWFEIPREVTDFMVHEPVKSCGPTSKWWALSVPLLIGTLFGVK